MKNFSKHDPNASGLVNFLYIFLVFFAVTFVGMFYLDARKIGQDSFSDSPPPSAFEKKIDATVTGYPIERMSPYIAGKDKKVATFLLAIAKKESNWGKFSPKKNGQQCWNFWGYRGSENPTPSGYSCFRSPGQAVNVVGSRIQELVDANIDTPREMAVWKCGYDCSWDNPGAVDKWVADVGYYYKKIYE